MIKLLSCVLAISFLTVGCAVPETTRTDAERGEVRTGSNIPRRNRVGPDRVDVITPEELERGRTGAGTPPPR
jgi:hypothetical protein